MNTPMTTALQTVQTQTQNQQAIYIPNEADWNFMINWGKAAMRSNMLPSAIKTPEAAAIIILKGRELGLSFMTALAHIHVINGRPTMSAELIQGMARKNLPGLVINIIESTNTVAKVEVIRPERGSKPYVQTFTWDDAVMAKLTGKDVWKQYPSAMLWSRAVTAALRKICPEALMGVSYTPEEMGADVDQDGNVIVTTGRPVVEGGQAPEVPKPPTQTQKSNAEHPDGRPASKQGDEQAAARKAEMQKIGALRVDLEITVADLKAVVFEQFKIDDATKLTLDQLQQITAMLEQEKKVRAEQSTKPEVDADWEKDALSMGPLPTN